MQQVQDYYSGDADNVSLRTVRVQGHNKIVIKYLGGDFLVKGCEMHSKTGVRNGRTIGASPLDDGTFRTFLKNVRNKCVSELGLASSDDSVEPGEKYYNDPLIVLDSTESSIYDENGTIVFEITKNTKFLDENFRLFSPGQLEDVAVSFIPTLNFTQISPLTYKIRVEILAAKVTDVRPIERNPFAEEEKFYQTLSH